jgi:phosphoglycolate phosphatase-like HAD superfamily hydrolase
MAGSPLPRAIVFDCDGVLIESVDIKTEAFVTLFADYPEHSKAIAEHHLAHLGVSRFEKFRWIHSALLRREPSAGELEELGRRFSALVASAVRSCPEVKGTSAALETLRARNIPLHIASGTPQDELESVIAARGWRPLFASVCGSPRTKPEILAAIARQAAAEPRDLLFVGDGRSDLDAARHVGVPFILRDTAAQAGCFGGYHGARVASLEGFGAQLPRLWTEAVDDRP